METTLENQHRKITGYRELSQVEIDLMNEIKAAGARLYDLCAKVEAHNISLSLPVYSKETPLHADDIALMQLTNQAQSWLMHGTHELQTGLMKLTRAVAKPTTF